MPKSTKIRSPLRPGGCVSCAVLFSSLVFLTIFLPAVLLLAWAVPTVRWKNAFLLLASLVFYAWGEKTMVFLMMGTVAFNAWAGPWIARSDGRPQRLRLTFAVLANLLPLVYFKYIGFLARSVWEVGTWFGAPEKEIGDAYLPIGISFFTFQSLAYLIDVKRGLHPAERNPFRLGLFISFFPQLIAGPIVRYRDIARHLKDRLVTWDGVAHGAGRFVIGLSKKLLIADQVAVISERLFKLPSDQLTVGAAWLGALAYAIQIFFDFSGYSDMAIGMGRMLGFRIPENFRRPYAAQSVREFWQRWHITLSTWFRDYLYIPLGGNRGSFWRTQRNLLIVFVLTGLWHGANWTFLVWGLWHGAFLMLERGAFGRGLTRLPRLLRHLYLVAAVGLGWIWFAASSLGQGAGYFRALVAGDGAFQADWLARGFPLIALILGVVCCLPWPRPSLRPALEWQFARSLVLLALLLGCLVLSGAEKSNAFIYYRF